MKRFPLLRIALESFLIAARRITEKEAAGNSVQPAAR